MTWKNAPSVGRHTIWALGMAIVMLAAPTICSAEEILITIDIAPATLNIQSNGKVVTVHTDIAYSDIEVFSVFLEGVHINSSKADDRGYFVAKFLIRTSKVSSSATTTSSSSSPQRHPVCRSWVRRTSW